MAEKDHGGGNDGPSASNATQEPPALYIEHKIHLVWILLTAIMCPQLDRFIKDLEHRIIRSM